MSIADNLESKIEKGELRPPIPRWIVNVRRMSTWAALAALLSLGAVSAGVAGWFALDPNDIAENSRRHGLLGNILEALPLFWGAVSMACGFLAIWLFSKADRGYRYRFLTVSLSCLIAFMALGFAVASAGLADEVEGFTSDMLPGYARLAEPHVMKYHRPEDGNWVGRIESMSTSSILLEDLNGKKWNVTLIERKDVEDGKCVSVVGVLGSATSQTVIAHRIGSCPHGVRVLRQVQRVK